ncbi:MAG TPA: hypothetical protein GXX23_07580 [Firmicutes bacterium]|nr:hypothetical protein [Candidatus Fermentithermobacillaceae bacterium]
MIPYAIRNLVWHLAACLGVCWAVGRFSSEGPVYAGFMAAFLGSAYLLAGWLAYLKSIGTDLVSKLKGRQPPEVPYFHRKQKTRRPLLRLGRKIHTIDDDLAETVNDQAGGIPPDRRHKIDAACYAVVGLMLLVLSLL